MATECANRQHSAVFPRELPAWFLKLFTQEGDRVLDPFVGSGTVCAVAQEMGRHSVGIEMLAEYYEMAQEKVGIVQHCLFEESATYGNDK
jgi:site-specific DNA-methyltransferase (adenine-specific)/site-specific DNA-methyltransferase (cytosine-N4-specific)